MKVSTIAAASSLPSRLSIPVNKKIAFLGLHQTSAQKAGTGDGSKFLNYSASQVKVLQSLEPAIHIVVILRSVSKGMAAVLPRIMDMAGTRLVICTDWGITELRGWLSQCGMEWGTPPASESDDLLPRRLVFGNFSLQKIWPASALVEVSQLKSQVSELTQQTQDANGKIRKLQVTNLKLSTENRRLRREKALDKNRPKPYSGHT